jgi:hypothetical protein
MNGWIMAFTPCIKGKLFLNYKNKQMKQGNSRKIFGLIAMISAMMGGILARPKGVTHQDLEVRKSILLTNGGRAPIPNRVLNQRQKRKQYRQSHTCS